MVAQDDCHVSTWHGAPYLRHLFHQLHVLLAKVACKRTDPTVDVLFTNTVPILFNSTVAVLFTNTVPILFNSTVAVLFTNTVPILFNSTVAVLFTNTVPILFNSTVAVLLSVCLCPSDYSPGEERVSLII